MRGLWEKKWQYLTKIADPKIAFLQLNQYQECVWPKMIYKTKTQIDTYTKFYCNFFAKQKQKQKQGSCTPKFYKNIYNLKNPRNITKALVEHLISLFFNQEQWQPRKPQKDLQK